MARVEHKSLVNYIRKCPMHLKMVVVSDERARKVRKHVDFFQPPRIRKQAAYDKLTRVHYYVDFAQVELHMRYVHLQKKLQDKMRELEDLQLQERDILSGESELSLRRSNNSPSPLSGPCIAAAAKVCCFCPPSKAEKLEAKEKSKSIGSTTTERLMKESLYYDCYRKSQSTRELHKEQSSSCGKLTSQTQKASSGGDITLSSTTSSNTKPILNSNSMTKVNSITTTTQPQPQQHRPGCFHNLSGSTSLGNSSNANSPSVTSPPNFSLNSPQQAPPNSTMSSTGGSAAGTNSVNTSGYVSDSTPKCGSSSKPKSWDNLLGTKSFGGYGFGFGYGYFPQRAQDGSNVYHFAHPHHHNHHTHCSGHLHSNYYFKQSKSQQTNAGSPLPSATSAHPPGIPAPTTATSPGGTTCYVSHHRYHAYPTGVPLSHGCPASVAASGPHSSLRSPFRAPPSLPATNGSQVSNCRTLPLPRPSVSRKTAPGSNGGAASKMEKTLSDSSLNSEHHKDFPKTMSYFRGSENDDAHYSSEDEYDQYATESSYEGKRIFV